MGQTLDCFCKAIESTQSHRPEEAILDTTSVNQAIYFCESSKALLHGTIFLATCNAILRLGDEKLENTCFHHSLLIYS